MSSRHYEQASDQFDHLLEVMFGFYPFTSQRDPGCPPQGQHEWCWCGPCLHASPAHRQRSRPGWWCRAWYLVGYPTSDDGQRPPARSWHWSRASPQGTGTDTLLGRGENTNDRSACAVIKCSGPTYPWRNRVAGDHDDGAGRTVLGKETSSVTTNTMLAGPQLTHANKPTWWSRQG